MEEYKSVYQKRVCILSEEAQDKMRRAGRLARHVIDLAHAACTPGTTTDEIDRIVHEVGHI